ncbi:MAG: hypothetical protein ACREEW_07465 [Caulobacteraceae bacterium]
MASTTVSDYVIWAKHIHDDPELVQRVLAMWAGETIHLEVDGVRGTWRKMDDGADGRPTPGIRPIGSAQEVWRYLFKRRRGEVVSLKVVESHGGVAEASEPERRAKQVLPLLERTEDERKAALAALLGGRRQGYSSEGRTVTRDEMHER